MPTKIAARQAARVSAAVLAAGSTFAVPAAPAGAHGAPVSPVSRTAACAGGGSRTTVAACRAAREATAGGLGAYDNLRLAGVGGADRAAVPDGRLCSGGLPAYRGLDLARADFPATTVRSGQDLAVGYRATIAHRGSFRIYLTRPGYAADAPLTWDDLEKRPLLEVSDPPVRDGAYRMRVALPERTGRHILYIVWQTSGTPDTYYSCSDLVFAPARTNRAAVVASPSPTASAARSAAPPPSAAPLSAEALPPSDAPGSTGAPTTAAATTAAAVALTPAAADDRAAVGRLLIGLAVAVAAITAAIAGLTARRRRRAGR